VPAEVQPIVQMTRTVILDRVWECFPLGVDINKRHSFAQQRANQQWLDNIMAYLDRGQRGQMARGGS
jgi:hypothetical protein